jgi:hypothetical protein
MGDRAKNLKNESVGRVGKEENAWRRKTKIDKKN